MPSLLLIQWGIVGFFVLFYFIIGFFRGTLKTGYYTLVSILLTLIVLWIVSGISFGTYFSSQEFVDLIQSNSGNAIPSDFATYLLQPSVIALVFAIVDVVVRIVVFYVLYIFFKWFLSFVVFGTLYKYSLEKQFRKLFKSDKVLVKEGESLEDAGVTLKKRYKTFGDRMGGAAIGAVRGLITVFVLLMPLLVLVSTASNLTFDDTTSNVVSSSQLATGDQGVNALITTDIEDIVNWVNEINENNFADFFGGLGDSLFDWAFETELGNGTAFNLRDELSTVVTIVDTLNDNGFLDDAFDVEAIDEADMAVINDVIDLIQTSNLVIGALDAGSLVAAEGLIEDLLDVDFSSNTNAQAGLAELRNLDWKAELDNLQALVDAVLAFGSVAELLDLSNDVNQLFDVSSEQVTALADVFRRLGDLQLVKVLNVGLEYAVTLEDATNLIEWLPETEREAYLKDVLATILADTEFFFGEEGDLYNIADLVEIVLSQYGDFAISQLLAEEVQIENLISEDVEDFLYATLNGVTEAQTVVEVLPLAVDFGIYSALDGADAQPIAEALEQAVEGLDVNAEFNTFADIYSSLVTIGASEFLTDSPDVLALLDSAVQNNLEDAKLLVDQIFEQSVLVNAALDAAVPVVIDLAVEDADLKALLDVVLFSGDDLAFNIGGEIVKLLDIVKALNDVVSFSELSGALEDDMALYQVLDTLMAQELDVLEGVLLDTLKLAPVDRALSLAFLPIVDYLLADGDFKDIILGVATNSPAVSNMNWKDELGVLVSAMFDLLDSLNTANVFDQENLAAVMEDTNALDVSALLNAYDTEAEVQAAFGVLNESLIVRAYLPGFEPLYEDVLSGVIEGHKLSMPALAMEGELLKDDALVQMITPLMSILDDAFTEAGIVTLGDALNALDMLDSFELYDIVYAIEAADLDALAATDLLRGLVSELLFDETVQNFLYSIVFDASGLELSSAFVLDRADNLVTAEELGDMFTIIHDLAFPKSLLVIQDSRVFLSSDVLLGYLQGIGENEYEVLFDNQLINDLLTSVLDDPGMVLFAESLYDDMLAPSLVSVADGLGIEAPNIDVASFVEGFAGIKNAQGQFDLRQLVPFIEAYQALGIEAFADFDLIYDASFFVERWDAIVSDENVVRALDSRLLTYPLGFVLGDEVSGGFTAAIVNQLVADFGVSFPASAFTFDAELFEANGDLKPEYLAQIAGAAYAILNLDAEFGLKTLLALDEPVRIFGKTESILDHILNVEILFQIIDTVTIEPQVLDGLTAIANSFIQDFLDGNPDLVAQIESLGVDPEAIVLGPLQLIPEALDDNGRFSRAEIRALLSVVGAVAQANPDDLANLGSMTSIYNIVKDTEVVEALLSSEWINATIALGLNNQALFNAAVADIESTVESQLGLKIDVDYSLLDITEAKYDVFYETEAGNLRIKPAEVKHLILSVLAVDFANVSFGGVTDIYALLDAEDSSGTSLIDNLLQSKILIALFDKVLNLDTDASNIRPALTAVINVLLADYLDGEILSSDVLEMRGVANEFGVIRADEIKKLLELGKLLGDGALDADIVFNLFLADNNMNGQVDFADIFDSNIILSLVSNLVAEPSVRAGIEAFLNDSANEFIDGVSMLDGFDFDASKVNIFLDTLVDEDGDFAYGQFIDLAQVAGALGITSMNAVNNLFLRDLLIELPDTLYNANFNGRNGFQFIAEIDMLRGLIDAFVLEQDAGYAWGLEFIMGMLSDNAPSVDPATLSMATEMRALDDENGLIEAQYVYELLLAIFAQEFVPVLDGTFVLGDLLTNLFAQPFDGIAKDRLDVFYDADIIDILLSGIVDDFTLEAALASYLNDTIKDAVASAGYSTDVDVLSYTDLGLSYSLIDEAAMRHMLQVVGMLAIEDFDDLIDLTNLEYTFELLNMSQTLDKLAFVLQTPVLDQALDFVFADHELRAVIIDVANQALVDMGYDGALEVSLLDFDDFVTDRQVSFSDKVDLAVAALIFLTTNDTFDPEWLYNFGQPKAVGLDNFTRIEYVMNSDLLFTIFNNVVTDYSLKVTAASILNAELPAALERLGLALDINVTPEALFTPEWAFDADGMFIKRDLELFLAAFNELELTAFGDFANLADIPTLHALFRDTQLIDYLMDTTLLSVYVAAAMSDTETLDGYANMANDFAMEAGYDLSIDRRILDFTDAKYDILTYNVAYDLYFLNVEDLKDLLVAVTSIDYLNLEVSGSRAVAVHNIVELLTTPVGDELSPIEQMASSDMVVALLDKVLNAQSQPYDLIQFGLEVADELFLNSIELLDGITLSSALFGLRPEALDANGVLDGDQLVQFVRAIDIFVTSSGFDAERLGFIVSSGQIDEFYNSAIITSYLSNALSSPDLQAHVVGFLNDAQSLAVLPDTLLSLSPTIYEGYFIKVSEIENLVNAAYYMGLLDPEVVAAYYTGLLDPEVLLSLGIATFTDLIGSNIDATTGDDDLDRVLDSGIIYSLFNNVILFPELGDIIVDFAITKVGLDMSFIDFTMPAEVIGDPTDLTIEVIEQNRVLKSAWRDLIVAINALNLDEQLESGILGLNSITDMIDLGLNLITDMIDFDNPSSDNLSLFLASDILYTFIVRVIDDAYLGDQLGSKLPEELAGLLGNVSFVSPLDARGNAGIEDGLFSRAELRKLFESVSYVSIDSAEIDPNFLSYIFNLVDSNVDPITLEDDFDRFFESLYIQDKFSAILLSDDIIALIAGELFDAADFIPGLPASATFTLGDTLRLSAGEFRNLFVALATLGITDLNNVSLDISSLGDLESAQLDDVLASDFVYTIIDLVLKAQDTIAIPASALEDAGDYIGMVKKSEISTILGAVNTDFDPNTATIADLEGLYNQDSAIIDGIITTAVEDLLGILPAEAYSGDNLLRTEIRAILDTLLILADQDNTTLLSSFDFANLAVTIADLDDLRLLGSEIVSMLLTDVISGVLTVADDAYIDGDNTKVLTPAELERFVAMLLILTGGDDTVDLSTLDFANLAVTAGMVDDLANLNSVIVRDILSDVVTGALTVPADAYDAPSTTRLLSTEIQAFADMILILVDNDRTTDISTLDFTNLTVTAGMLDDLAGLTSVIVRDILSDVVTDALTVPAASFDAPSTTRLLSTEIQAFADMILVLVNNVRTTDIATLDFSNLTITTTQLTGLNAINSTLVDGIVSEAIVGSLEIPTGAFINGSTTLVQKTEITSLISVLELLGKNDLSQAGTMDASTISPANLGTMLDEASLIVYRLVAGGIIATGNVVTGQFAVTGDVNYDANAVDKDMKISEMVHIADSLVTLGVTSLSNIGDITSDVVSALTTAELEAVVDLNGSNTYMYYLLNDIVATPNALAAYNLANPGTTIIADGNGFVTKAEIITLIEFTQIA